MRSTPALQIGLTVLLLAACAGNEATNPQAVSARKPTLQTSPPWGPETPHFNDEIILRGDGFGLVKFRQPNDADRIVYLDTWFEILLPIPPISSSEPWIPSWTTIARARAG